MDPTVALTTCERALRQLLRHVLNDRYGPDWVTQVPRPSDVELWRERAEVESRKRRTRGVARVSTDLLDYAELYQLRQLLEKHWGLFAEALGDRRRTGALLERFDDLRNTVAHSRPLLPFESDLLAGIAGEVRNRVTLYMSTAGPGGEHHARIEGVTDGFGFTISGPDTITSPNPAMHTGLDLQIGQVVTFQCSATDPHGRDIVWSLQVSPSRQHGVETLHGQDVEFRWVVDASNISDHTVVFVKMSSTAEYHRYADQDGMTLFYYRVVPPTGSS